MRIREGMIDVPGGRVWYRSVGQGGIPLLCLHGGPGMTHNYIEPLEDLGDRRRVIFYDQLGCGRSDKPDDTSLWTVPHFVREVEVVRSALELDRFHLFGSSWGGQLSMQYVLDYQPASLASLLMSGSPASMPCPARTLVGALYCSVSIRGSSEKMFTIWKLALSEAALFM